MDLSCLPGETEPHARVFSYGCQQPERVSLEEVRDYITEAGNPGNKRRVSRVEIYGNFPLLHSCSLVDTPGANAVIEQHGEMVYDFLPRADAIIMTVMAGQPVTASEAAMLKELAADAQRRVFYVLTKVDDEDPSDLSEICQFMKEKIVEQGLGTPDTIYRVAAKPVFEARCAHKPQEEIDALRQQWGIAPLERTLESFILKSSDGGRLLAKRVREATEKARQAFNAKKKANEAIIETQDVSVEDLQKEKKRLLAEFEQLKKGLEKKLASFSHKWDTITDRSVAGLETLVSRLQTALETRIDSAHMVDSIKNAFQLGSVIRSAVQPTLEDYLEERAAQYEKLIATLDEEVQEEVSLYASRCGSGSLLSTISAGGALVTSATAVVTAFQAGVPVLTSTAAWLATWGSAQVVVNGAPWYSTIASLVGLGSVATAEATSTAASAALVASLGTAMIPLVAAVIALAMAGPLTRFFTQMVLPSKIKDALQKAGDDLRKQADANKEYLMDKLRGQLEAAESDMQQQLDATEEKLAHINPEVKLLAEQQNKAIEALLLQGTKAEQETLKLR